MRLCKLWAVRTGDSFSQKGKSFSSQKNYSVLLKVSWTKLNCIVFKEISLFNSRGIQLGTCRYYKVKRFELWKKVYIHKIEAAGHDDHRVLTTTKQKKFFCRRMTDVQHYFKCCLWFDVMKQVNLCRKKLHLFPIALNHWRVKFCYQETPFSDFQIVILQQNIFVSHQAISHIIGYADIWK